MYARLSMLVSGLLHAGAFLVLSAQSAPLTVRYSVREGQADAQQSATIRGRMTPVDTRLDEPAPIEFTVPPVEVQMKPALPPQSANLDDRPSTRPPLDDVLLRRSVRRASLPDAVALGARTEATATIANEFPQPMPSALSEPINAPEQRVDVNEVSRPRAAAAPVEVIEAELPSLAASGSDAPQGAKVDRVPSPFPANPEPPYPEELRRRQISGRVILRVRVASDGHVESVRVEMSSGYPEMDESARTTIALWRFQPAQRGQTSVPLEIRLPVSFDIRRL